MVQASIDNQMPKPALTIEDEVAYKWWKEVEELHKARSDNPLPKSWTMIPSMAEITLDEYCADESNPLTSQVPWANCGECEIIFASTGDYLCRSCRALV